MGGPTTPTNPRLMARVLEAVTYLREGKGSTAKDIMSFVTSNLANPPRNLTMQVNFKFLIILLKKKEFSQDFAPLIRARLGGAHPIRGCQTSFQV